MWKRKKLVEKVGDEAIVADRRAETVDPLVAQEHLPGVVAAPLVVDVAPLPPRVVVPAAGPLVTATLHAADIKKNTQNLLLTARTCELTI